MTLSSEHNRFGAGLILLAAFALGILAGAALLHMAQLALHGPPPRHGPPPPPGPPPLAHLERELDLDREQVDQLREILEGSRERMQGEVEATGERIRQILTPKQRERFDSMRQSRPPGPFHFPGPPRNP